MKKTLIKSLMTLICSTLLCINCLTLKSIHSIPQEENPISVLDDSDDFVQEYN